LIVNCIPRFGGGGGSGARGWNPVWLLTGLFALRSRVVQLLVILSLALVGGWLYRLARLPQHGVLDREDVSRILSRFTFSSGRMIPSHWVARGLHAAGNARPVEALYYLGLVWSNGLFLYLLTAWTAGRLYRRGYDRLSTGTGLMRKPGGRWLDAFFGACLPFVRPSTRLLLVKDFRTFRRDPQQWVQILIFSGLMILYILNIRSMFVTGIQWQYQNSISLLNLFAVALLLCTYTGRFIYPLLSLEGRKFWILGLLPLRREQLLWGKFAFSLTGTLLLAELLIVLSDVMLYMPLPVILLHAVTVLVLAAGLSGLAVGLGAVMPNFRESDPSKIAVGFGGTLNLVASLLFVLLVLVLMAGPWHVQMYWAATGRDPLLHPSLVWLGAALGVNLGILAVALPLRAGVANLRKMEF
jgi:ABC-2 type transport system permease protein